MGLLSWWTGVDLEEERRRGAEADARLAALQARQRDRFTDTQWATMQEHLAEQQGYSVDPEAQVAAAFGEGLKEGYDKTTGAIRATVAAPFNFVFKSLPWQLYVAVALFAAWKFGWLKKWLSPKT